MEGWIGKIQFFLVKETGLAPVPPSVHIRGIKLRREFEMKTKRAQSLVITASSEGSSHGKKVGEFLADFFNIPMLSVEQAVSKYSASTYISTNTSS